MFIRICFLEFVNVIFCFHIKKSCDVSLEPVNPDTDNSRERQKERPGSSADRRLKLEAFENRIKMERKPRLHF